MGRLRSGTQECPPPLIIKAPPNVVGQYGRGAVPPPAPASIPNRPAAKPPAPVLRLQTKQGIIKAGQVLPPPAKAPPPAPPPAEGAGRPPKQEPHAASSGPPAEELNEDPWAASLLIM